MATETVCTPYISRTIKGWTIRLKLCFQVDSTVYTVDLYSAQISPIPALLNNLTNSLWYPGGGWGVQQVILPGTSTSDYDNAEDSAVFTFVTVSGTLAKVGIPNPKDSIFLADKMTVDPANAAVAAFVGALAIGTAPLTGFAACTASGAAFDRFIGGLRVRKHTRRKMNIWVRNPELTAPGI